MVFGLSADSKAAPRSYSGDTRGRLGKVMTNLLILDSGPALAGPLSSFYLRPESPAARPRSPKVDSSMSMSTWCPPPIAVALHAGNEGRKPQSRKRLFESAVKPP